MSTLYRLKNRDSTPPGGWKYYQPETGWTLPNPMECSFVQAVKSILNHRLLNRSFQFSLDMDQIAWELDNFTALRLSHNPQYVASYDPERQPPQVVHASTTHTSRCGACR